MFTLIRIDLLREIKLPASLGLHSYQAARGLAGLWVNARGLEPRSQLTAADGPECLHPKLESCVEPKNQRRVPEVGFSIFSGQRGQVCVCVCVCGERETKTE